MKQEEPKQLELRKKIEIMSGISPKSPRDFDFLSSVIHARTRQKISATTLKRLWGYIEKDSDSQIRISTLDILSNFVGYVSWASFCDLNAGANGSDFIATRTLYAKDLTTGAIIRLLWNPDRCILIRFEGSDVFTVIESRNSKLMVGDTFHTSAIIDKHELLLTELCRPGMQPCSYICGRMGGVTFEVM